jgi:hypothetical protein
LARGHIEFFEISLPFRSRCVKANEEKPRPIDASKRCHFVRMLQAQNDVDRLRQRLLVDPSRIDLARGVERENISPPGHCAGTVSCIHVRAYTVVFGLES